MKSFQDHISMKYEGKLEAFALAKNIESTI